jgi:MFS-type transporter involved in bile tolerance (Atg22 family)
MYFLGIALMLFALICFWIIPCLRDAFNKKYGSVESLIVAMIIAVVLSVVMIAL